jgi:hypothetical protein
MARAAAAGSRRRRFRGWVVLKRGWELAMKNTLLFACAVVGGTVTFGAQSAPLVLSKAAPTVDQILSLKRVGSPELSPDGRWVAYTVRETNWDENAYETEIWLADTAATSPTAATRQLTN